MYFILFSKSDGIEARLLSLGKCHTSNLSGTDQYQKRESMGFKRAAFWKNIFPSPFAGDPRPQHQGGIVCGSREAAREFSC